jgi:hypothetical protein
MSLSEKLEALHKEVSDAFERAVSDLRRDVSQRLHSSSEDLMRRLEGFSPQVPDSLFDLSAFAPLQLDAAARARRGSLTGLRDDLVSLDGARTQAEILNALLAAARHHASRSALFLTRADGVRGWGSEGFGDAAAALQGLNLQATPGGSWERLATGGGAAHLSAAESADLSSRLEVPVPQGAALVPLVLRDRVAAALYADSLGDDPLELEALQVLAYAAAQAIETLPFRERKATPTLHLDGEPAAPLGFWPPATPATAGPAPSATAPAPAVEAAPAPPVPAPAPPVAAAPEPAPPAPAPAAPAAPLPSPTSTQASHVEEEEIRTERHYPRPVDEPPMPPMPPQPPSSPAPAEASQNATVLLPRSSYIEPVPPPHPSAVFPPAAEPPVEQPPVVPAAGFDELRATASPSGTVEVKPPTDLDGPGWAFNTTRVSVGPGDEALHEEARRLARLLVSEIKLYNEEQVEEGRRNRDIYERLKEDIDRSRQMYEERVEEKIRLTTDYFYQELVRILAAGDSKALGI